MTRIAALDLIRGVAVLGIAAMNIVAFAMPLSAYTNPASWGHHSAADWATWAASFLFVDGKMRALFAMLFGASAALVFDRAAAAGDDPARVHGARMAVLFLIGLAHYYLIWFGDILSLYAAVGLLLLPFLRRPAADLVAPMIFALLLGLAITGVPAALAELNAAGGALARDMAALYAPPRSDLLHEVALHRAGWTAMTGWRLGELASGPMAQIATAGAETFGQMLLGLWLFRIGFLAGVWQPSSCRRLAWAALAGGLIPTAMLGTWAWASGFDPVTLGAIGEAWGHGFATLIAVGYAALLLLWLFSGRAEWLRLRFQAAGRCAFSNYIGTSVVMVALFDRPGMFGAWSRAELLPLLLLAWVAMLAWPQPWLARFRYGPLEWLWRSLARGAPQPMRGAAG